MMAGGPIKKHSPKNSDFVQSPIIEKGVTRILNIPKTKTGANRFTPYTPSDITAKHGIVIRFKKMHHIDISNLENQYGLRLKAKLKTGYLIFENRSKLSDLALIKKIITTEKDIDTLKPNWKLRKRPY